MKTSLVTRLSLAICLFLLITVSGSFMISLGHARDQLTEQLSAHAQDSATALGLSLAPHIQDQAMVDLMLNAMFDGGHFARISVSIPNGSEVLAERVRDEGNGSAPAWFSRLANIQPLQGNATVMDGWRQAAQVQVVSHTQASLLSLWQSAVGILFWLGACALLCGVFCAFLIRRALRPLQKIIAQAEAIGRSDYQTNPDVPRTAELQPVAAAMNQMADRLKTLFEQESARTNEYRRQAWQDHLTGLPNRLALGQTLAAALAEEDASGHLLALRLCHLEAINQQSGADHADALLSSIGALLLRWQAEQPAWLCSRSRGAEFVILAPDTTAEELQPLMKEVAALANEQFLPPESPDAPLAIGVTVYQPGDTAPNIMSRLTQALAESRWVAGQPEFYPVLPDSSASQQAVSEHDWLVRLRTAMDERQIQAVFQPVFSAQPSTDILHHKLLVRLPEPDGSMLPAARFLPWVRRLGLAEAFDLCVLEIAARQLRAERQPLAISITPETLATPQARQCFCSALAQHALAGGMLTVEVDARYHTDVAVLRAFSHDLANAGARLALQHFGHTPALLGELRAANLHYLKVDSSLSRDLKLEQGKGLYLEMLVRMAAHLGLPLIAEQVQTAGELDALKALGFDGIQGNAVGQPAAWPRTETPVSG